MRKLILIIMPFILMSCNESSFEEEILNNECLTDFEIEQATNNCDSTLLSQNCDILYLGPKSLSENLKSDFKDFCNSVDTELIFEDSNGNTNLGIIQEKKFYKDSYLISSHFSNPDCEGACLSNEEAYVILQSDKFSLKIMLLTGLNIGFNGEYSNENIVSKFSIWALNENIRQLIFEIAVENYLDEQINTDTSYVRYHENITLNDKDYSGIYSNENNNVNGLIFKEKVYFDLKGGLVAVRDSLGVLWTIQENQ